MSSGKSPRSLMQLHEPGRASADAPRGFALWNLGFRPFYLFGSIYASIAALLWAGQYAGFWGVAFEGGPSAHAREMTLGFVLAIVAGFLLTAVRNWTAQPTPDGAPLAGLVGIWMAARVLAYTPFIGAAAWCNALFVVLLAIAIGRPLLHSGNRRNYVFLGLLALVAVFALATRFQALARIDTTVALDVVLLLMAIVGGRVIPMFTNGALPAAGAVRIVAVDRVALASVWLLLFADALHLSCALLAPLAGFASLAHALRLALWRPWRTRSAPLVWILHAGYGWIVVHLGLRVLACLDWIAPPIAVHALTIGAIGAMTLGMMTRTARGHTARPLRAAGPEIACYVLVLTAAIVRVLGGALLPEHYTATVVTAAIAWSAAYGVYAVSYWPVLSRPRLDGKPG